MALKIAIDTNRYADLQSGLPETVELLDSAQAILLPFVVLAELRVGFQLGNRQAENESALRRFLMTTGTTVLYADDQTTHQYSHLYRQLRRQGTPIPANDLWIAALVLQHNLVLHSRDKHFDHLPQIIRV